jgi:hypothetical protein
VFDGLIQFKKQNLKKSHFFTNEKNYFYTALQILKVFHYI